VHHFNTADSFKRWVGSKVSSEVPKPVSKEVDSRAEAFEKEYKQSHPDGPYPPVETKPKTKTEPT
jgi:hypothetical protein